jgi:integrase
MIKDAIIRIGLSRCDEILSLRSGSPEGRFGFLRADDAPTGLNLLAGGRMINPWRWRPRVMKQIQRRKAKGRLAKSVLRLPDLEVAKSAVLNSLSCPDAQRGYRHAIDEFVDWYCSEPRLSFSKTVVVRYRMHLESRHLAPGTINLRLGAVRRLAYEAADCGLLSADLAAGIRRVKGVKKLGVRLGNWLTAEQGITLWQAPDRERLKGKRDRALLSVLLACGLRRHEVAELAVDHLQQREGHWAIVNLSGKGGHVRTVPVPDWVYCELSTWMEAAGIKGGRVFRRVSSAGKSWGDGVTQKLAWWRASHPTTCAGRARVYVGRPGVNWSRFSFSSAMCRSKRLSATSAARNVSPQP